MIEVCGGPFNWESLFADQKRSIPKPEPAGGAELKRPLRPRYIGLTTVLDKKARDNNNNNNNGQDAESPEDEPRRCERTLLENALLYGAKAVYTFLTEDGGAQATVLFASFLARRRGSVASGGDLPTALLRAMQKERNDDDVDGEGGKPLPAVPLFARYPALRSSGEAEILSALTCGSVAAARDNGKEEEQRQGLSYNQEGRNLFYYALAGGHAFMVEHLLAANRQYLHASLTEVRLEACTLHHQTPATDT
jgi:hypothetical protein